MSCFLTLSHFPDFNASLDSMMAKQEDEGVMRFKCLTCGKTMAAKKDLRRHVETYASLWHLPGQEFQVKKQSSQSLLNISQGRNSVTLEHEQLAINKNWST